MSTAFLGIMGPNQMILILVVVLLLFGGRKIPELMRGLGRGVKEFKDGVADDENTEDSESNSNNEVELGVFVLEEGKAIWTPVNTGIQDARYIALGGDGIVEGVSLITGPYDVVSRSLNHRDEVDLK